MKVIRKIRLLSLLAIVTLFTQNASATLTSSYYYGSTYYSTPEGQHGRIDFAVYDDRDEYFSLYDLEAPGTGDYVYAYQIFHDVGVNPAVSYFAILGIGGAPVDGIDCHDDQSGGVASTDEYFTDSKGVWVFDEGILYAGKHSCFLVLSSETDWVPGEYEIKPGDEFPVPTPEPGTLTLVGIGAAIAFIIKRRKSVR